MAGRCLRAGRKESEGGPQIPCGPAEPVRPRTDPDPARGRAEAARCAPPRAPPQPQPPPPPLRANFAVSLKETSWGLRAVGEGRSGALGAIARPGRSRMCPRDEQLAAAGWRASGSLGACPSLSSPGPSAPRSSGDGMERKRPAGRWWCRGPCPLGKFRAGPGFGWVGGGGWAGAVIRRDVTRMVITYPTAAASWRRPRLHRLWPRSHCWKSKRQPRRGVPGGLWARTSASPGAQKLHTRVPLSSLR